MQPLPLSPWLWAARWLGAGGQKEEALWALASRTSPPPPHLSCHSPHSPVTLVATGEAKTAGPRWNFTQQERTKEILTPSQPPLARSCSGMVRRPCRPRGKKSRGEGLCSDPDFGASNEASPGFLPPQNSREPYVVLQCWVLSQCSPHARRGLL